MPDTWLPEADAALLAFASPFAETIAHDPQRYGVSPAQSQSLTERANAFADAMENCLPQYRSAMATSAKNAARERLKADIRALGRLITAQPFVTDEMRQGLGLAVRAAARRAAVPQDMSILRVVGVVGTVVTVDVRTPDAKAKPAGCVGFTLLGRVDALDAANGHAAVAGDPAWRFLGNFSRGRIDVDFGALPPGARVTLTAEYMNTRLEPGPRAAGVSTYLQGGSLPHARHVGRPAGRPMARAA